MVLRKATKLTSARRKHRRGMRRTEASMHFALIDTRTNFIRRRPKLFRSGPRSPRAINAPKWPLYTSHRDRVLPHVFPYGGPKHKPRRVRHTMDASSAMGPRRGEQRTGRGEKRGVIAKAGVVRISTKGSRRVVVKNRAVKNLLDRPLTTNEK